MGSMRDSPPRYGGGGSCAAKAGAALLTVSRSAKGRDFIIAWVIGDSFFIAFDLRRPPHLIGSRRELGPLGPFLWSDVCHLGMEYGDIGNEN